MPKFQGIAEKLDDLLAHKQEGFIYRLWFLEPEEKAALIEAYKEARRARFEAQVFHDLLSPQEELNVATRQHPRTGKTLMQGWQGAVSKLSKEEGAKIVDRINKEFGKEYAENRNPRP
jgi:hypothetical protein